MLRARVHRLATAGRLRVPQRRAVELIHAAGTGAVLTLLATAVEHRDPELADVLFDAVMRTVLIETPPETSGSSGSSGSSYRSGSSDNTAAAAVTLRAAVPDLPRLTSGERALLTEWLDRLASG